MSERRGFAASFLPASGRGDTDVGCSALIVSAALTALLVGEFVWLEPRAGRIAKRTGGRARGRLLTATRAGMAKAAVAEFSTEARVG